MDTNGLRQFVIDRFCSYVQLDLTQVTSEDPTLAQVLERSSVLRNSVDLMEAFARTANALKREHGIKAKLPMLPLTARVSEVLDQLVRGAGEATA